MKTIIEIENIQKIYPGPKGLTALKDITFNIQRGEFVFITGHSGSGKSTLLHVLGCLDKPTMGRYSLDGINIEKLEQNELAEIRNKKIGIIFQNYSQSLIQNLSIKKNLFLPFNYGDIFQKEELEEKMILEQLEILGIRGKADCLPRELSGGEQQRAVIARALINKPLIIFGDEPTGSLDSETKKEIMRIFLQLNKGGKTVIIVTHEEDIIDFVPIKRKIILKDGLVTENEVC